MSQNVKINGKTYNGITKVNLPLADGTGSATFEEPSEGGDTVAALYPMAYSYFDGATKKKEISNGNHVSVTNLSAAAGSAAFTLNIPYCVNSIISTRAFDAQTVWLPIISAGKTIKFELKNVSVTGDGGYAVGFTVPNGQADFEVKPLGRDGNGINGTVGMSKTYTTTSDFQLSSCYLVYDQTAISAIEFDLEITVDGVRWI